MFYRIAYSSILLLSSMVSVAASEPAPYAGQQTRAIKALSAEEIQSYLDGKGMGFAKTAELNHYPGPSHVLEQAQALGLNEKQKESTTAIFSAMQAEAKRLGLAYVEKERELDQLFSSRQINAQSLRAALDQIGRLQAELRRVHLDAHLQVRAALTPEQIQKYDRIRGYVSGKDSKDSSDLDGGHHH